MLNRILQISIYLLGLLGTRSIAVSPQEAALKIAEPFWSSKPPMCLQGDDIYLNEESPVINSLLMSHHITSKSPEITAHFLSIFNDIRKSDPNIQLYFDFVFSHLKDFQIAIYSLEEIQSISADNVLAIYQPPIRTIILPEKLPSHLRLYSAIRHEMRHAAMHTAHILLSQPEFHRDVECFFPISSDKRNEISKFFWRGDKRLERTQELLKKETHSSHDLISKKEKSLLKKLRKKTEKLHSAYYLTTERRTFSLEDFNFISTSLKKNNLIGEIVNIDFYQSLIDAPHYGPIKFISIASDKKNVETSFIVLDPIYAALKNIIQDRATIQSSTYRKDQELYEREAQLVGAVPSVILKYLYPEIVNSTKQLIEQARHIPVSYQPPQHQHLSLFDFKNKILTASIDEVTFKPFDTQRYIGIADYYLSTSKKEMAIKALEIVVKKGDPKFLNQAKSKLEKLKPHSKSSDLPFFKSKDNSKTNSKHEPVSSSELPYHRP